MKLPLNATLTTPLAPPDYGSVMQQSTALRAAPQTTQLSPPDYDQTRSLIFNRIIKYIELEGGFATEAHSKNMLDCIVNELNTRHNQNYSLSHGSESRVTAFGDASVAVNTRSRIQEEYPGMDTIITDVSSCTLRNTQHSQNYRLSHGSESRETATGHTSIEHKTESKIRDKYPNFDDIIADISCHIHSVSTKKEMKSAIQRNMAFCVDLVAVYVDQACKTGLSNNARFDSLKKFANEALLDVASYLRMDKKRVCLQLKKDLLGIGSDYGVVWFRYTKDDEPQEPKPPVDRTKMKIVALFHATLGIDLR